MALAWFAALGLMGQGLTGCGDGPKSPPPNPDAAPAKPPAKPKTLPYERSFVVQTPGAEPRAILRYELTGGAHLATGTVELSSKNYSLQTNWTKPTTLTLREPWTWTVSPDPNAASALLTGTPGALETAAKDDAGKALLAPQEAAWAALHNRLFTARVDGRGYLSNVVFDHDKLASSAATQFAVAEVKQRWLGYTVPLPETPVGVGASWRVVSTLRAGSAVVTQDATYTLKAQDEKTWTFEVSIERTGEAQRLEASDLAPGVVAELMSSYRKFRGTLVVSQSWPWPLQGEAILDIGTQQRILPPGDTPQWIEFMSREQGTWKTLSSTPTALLDKQSGGPPGPPLAAPPGTAASSSNTNTAPKNSPH